MTSPGKAIEVDNLTKYYGDLLAVDHVTFDVVNGDFFGFLGPNGAGKTTTIRMLTNLTTPSEGGSRILGVPVTRKAVALRERIGVIPEVANVFAELTVLDNLNFTAEIYGIHKRDRKRRVNEVLELFDIVDKEKTRAAELSLGQKRRLSIAMGVIHDPDVLFLDEPTNGLDVHSAVTVRRILRDLNREGKTVFYTTHNMTEANELCRSIALIDGGRIIAIDTPEKLKAAAARSKLVEVAFDSPPAAAEEELSRLPGVERVRIAGDKYLLSTSDQPEVIESVYGYSRRRDSRIISLNTRGPSLEEVFVEMTKAGG